jgi:hypothetical protein
VRDRSVGPPVIRRAKKVAFAVVAITGLVACTATTPGATTPPMPTRSLGLALKPGPCLAGVNVISAAAFVSGPGEYRRYLEPREGDLRFSLVLDGQPPRPVLLRWLDVPDAPVQAFPGPPWNLELTFGAAVAGECPMRVEFRPSPQAGSAGVGPAVTTVVLKDSPPPPPLRVP